MWLSLFGIFSILILIPHEASTGAIGNPRLLYKEIPMYEALQKISKTSRARQPKQTNLLDIEETLDPLQIDSFRITENLENSNDQNSEETESAEAKVDKTETHAKPKTETAEPKTETAEPKTETAEPKIETAEPKTEQEPNEEQVQEQNVLPIDDIIHLGKGMETRQNTENDYEYDHQDDSEDDEEIVKIRTNEEQQEQEQIEPESEEKPCPHKNRQENLGFIPGFNVGYKPAYGSGDYTGFAVPFNTRSSLQNPAEFYNPYLYTSPLTYAYPQAYIAEPAGTYLAEPAGIDQIGLRTANPAEDGKKTGLLNSDTGKLVLGLGAGYVLYNAYKNHQQQQAYNNYYRPPPPQFAPNYPPNNAYYPPNNGYYPPQNNYGSYNTPYSGAGSFYGRTQDIETGENGGEVEDQVVIHVPYFTNQPPTDNLSKNLPKRAKRQAEDMKSELDEVKPDLNGEGIRQPQEILIPIIQDPYIR